MAESEYDAFGTGHSSLGYLKRLPVHELKIDQSFVLNLATHHSAAASKDRMIVRSTIALAHALGLEVVAEGVETQRAWELLTAFRCNTIQGFYVSPPLLAGDFEAWLRATPSFAGRPAPVACDATQVLRRVPPVTSILATSDNRDGHGAPASTPVAGHATVGHSQSGLARPAQNAPSVPLN